MLTLFLYILGAITLLIASIFDFRTKEIPDMLNYSLIAAAIFLRILFSFQEGFYFLLEGLAGMLAMGIFGIVLFYAGQWGGGDVKLLIGIGGIIGLEFSLISPLVIFLACVAFAGAAYGLISIFSLCCINFRSFRGRFAKSVKKHIKFLFFLIILAALSAVLILFSENPFLIALLAVAASFPFLFFIFLASKSLENICFKKTVLVEQLTEGDWLTKEIIADGKTIFKAKREGLYKKDIEKLKELKQKGLVDDVEIKTGLPFVPVFLFAFILFLIINYSGILSRLAI